MKKSPPPAKVNKLFNKLYYNLVSINIFNIFNWIEVNTIKLLIDIFPLMIDLLKVAVTFYIIYLICVGAL